MERIDQIIEEVLEELRAMDPEEMEKVLKEAAERWDRIVDRIANKEN